MKPTAHIAIRYDGHTFKVDPDRPVFVVAFQDSGSATEAEGTVTDRIRKLLLLGMKAFKVVAVLPEEREE
ncbi:MAG: hypothetical protein ACK6D3_12865 [Planctomycetaceae bacterium]|jgi:hypothetical protein